MSDNPVPAISAWQRRDPAIRALYVDRRRAAAASGAPWTIHAYRDAVDRSRLKSSVKNTLHVMVDYAGGPQTAVDRLTVCLLTGLKSECTITDHWQKARDAGLLTSKARWNRTSVHTFHVPGLQHVDDEVWGEPLGGWHVWAADEIAWWDSLRGGSWDSPPWRDGRHRPPF